MNANIVSCTDIDVCMIVCDESKMIEQSLSALLEAGFDSFVFVDMESRDDTCEKIRKLAGDRAQIYKYPRSSLLRFGYAEARNTCATFASREWVIFVDADEVLVNGCNAGTFQLAGVGATSGIASIERRNLAREHGSADGTIVIGSIEQHHRLYKPSLMRRWMGYIHEELHKDGVSGWNIDNKSTLIFDHYCALKPSSDGVERSGLYAFMLLRAFAEPALREGTNSWWYDTYVPEHLSMLESRAAVYASKHEFMKSLPLPDTIGGAGRGSGVLLRPVSVDDEAEAVFGLDIMRTLHSVSSKPWTGRSERVFWGEWNHPGEGPRTLTAIIQTTRSFNWHRFISPGQVCVDVGSHSGDTALPMALYAYDHQQNRRGQVIAVEPNPAVIPVLDINLSMNTHLADFYIVNAAITSDDVDEIELADHGNAGCNGGVLTEGSLSAPLEGKLQSIAAVRYKTQGISMKTLFKNIADSFNKSVGFIKLDCEGYDKEILRPCREIFNQSKPVLFVEWFSWFTSEDDFDLFSIIESINYIPFDPITLCSACPKVHIPDLLCIHAEDHMHRAIISSVALS